MLDSFVTKPLPDFVENTRDIVESLVQEFSDVITDTPGRLSKEIFEHKLILLDDTKICKQRPYRLSPAKSLSLNKQIDEMLENGIIQPSVSEFASPVVMVTKPDSTFRLTVDYRLLNSNTRSDS